MPACRAVRIARSAAQVRGGRVRGGCSWLRLRSPNRLAISRHFEEERLQLALVGSLFHCGLPSAKRIEATLERIALRMEPGQCRVAGDRCGCSRGDEEPAREGTVTGEAGVLGEQAVVRFVRSRDFSRCIGECLEQRDPFVPVASAPSPAYAATKCFAKVVAFRS